MAETDQLLPLSLPDPAVDLSGTRSVMVNEAAQQAVINDLIVTNQGQASCRIEKSACRPAHDRVRHLVRRLACHQRAG